MFIMNEARAELKFSSLEPPMLIKVNEAQAELKFSSLEPQKFIIMAQA